MEPEINKTKINHHSHDDLHASGENITIAFFLNFFFSIIELVGGFLTNSIAILSDALHDFGDSISLGMAWYFQKVSLKKPDSNYTYGYRRFSILSAIINSAVLLTGSAFVLYESVRRMARPAESHAEGMLLLAIFGIIVNGVAVLRLRKGHNLNEKVVSLHMLEDVLGWIAVLIGSVIMIFVDVPVLDPVMSAGISIYILYNVYHNMKSALMVILQRKPVNIDENEIRDSLMKLPNVKDIHDLHIWTMDNEYDVLTVHLVVDNSIKRNEQQALRAAAHELLKSRNIQHSTVEIEMETEECEWCED